MKLIRWGLLAALTASIFTLSPMQASSSSPAGHSVSVSLPGVPIGDPFGCSGYITVASHNTPAGNSYTTKGNVCFYYGDSTHIGPVSRFQCFRNGQPYGDGPGGCRWEWDQALQSADSPQGPWSTRINTEQCFTCGGIFVQDSDRFYGSAIHICQLWLRDIRVVTRGTVSQPDRVRFSLADGSQVLKDMANNTFSDVFFSDVGGPC